MQTLSNFINKADFGGYIKNMRMNASRGQNIIPAFCRGIAFDFKEFSLKPKVNEKQWSDRCQIITYKNHREGRCEECYHIKRQNESLLTANFHKIIDITKIKLLDNGLLDLREAIATKPEETKAKIKLTTKKSITDDMMVKNVKYNFDAASIKNFPYYAVSIDGNQEDEI